MTWHPDVALRALNFAEEKHRGQKVPSSEAPYLRHVTTVAAEVMNAIAVRAADDPVAHPTLAVACALLHDVVEDTDCELKEIAMHFGDEVAHGVSALTKDAALEKSERMADSLRRIKEAREEVAMVKMADRITNLQPPPAHWDDAKVAAYREQAREILSELRDACSVLAARLEEKIQAY